jgi:hypothetical protein
MKHVLHPSGVLLRPIRGQDFQPIPLDLNDIADIESWRERRIYDDGLSPRFMTDRNLGEVNANASATDDLRSGRSAHEEADI